MTTQLPAGNRSYRRATAKFERGAGERSRKQLIRDIVSEQKRKMRERIAKRHAENRERSAARKASAK